MKLPKHVREALSALRAEGLNAEVECRSKHYRITVDGQLALTLHLGTRLGGSAFASSALRARIRQLKGAEA